MEATSISAVDVATTAWEVKGILSTVANFTAAMKFLSIALLIFAVLLAGYVALKILKFIYRGIILTVLSKIVSIPKSLYNFVFNRH